MKGLDFSFEVSYNLLQRITMQLQHGVGVIIWFSWLFLFNCFIKIIKIAFYDEILLMKYLDNRTKGNASIKVDEMLKSISLKI